MSRKPWERPVSSLPSNAGAEPRRPTRRLPLGLIPAVLAGGAVALVVLPLIGLLQRAHWSTLREDLRAGQAFKALRLSLETSLGAVAVSIVLGIPLAWILARRSFPGRAFVRALVTLPM